MKTPPIPEWLVERLALVLHMDIHYEATLYGPLNAYLGVFFPSSQQFLIKPQARILPGRRTTSDEDEAVAEATHLYLPYEAEGAVGDSNSDAVMEGSSDVSGSSAHEGSGPDCIRITLPLSEKEGRLRTSWS